MEYTVKNLEYAVSVFYASEHAEQAQAHQWLTSAQMCPQAWSFVWELLQSTKGTEVKFFAATTLHTKLLRCWYEVPPENYKELKNKILDAIVAFANGPKIVLNRLCISLAAYVLQSGAGDLAEILLPFSGPQHIPLLLEILTVIPEEFNSMTMSSELRSKTRVALQRASPAVLDDMKLHLQSAYGEGPFDEDTVQVWGAAATCAGSWLALGGDVTAEGYCDDNVTCMLDLEDTLPLCDALLKLVHRIYWNSGGELSSSALEASEAALGAIRSATTAPGATRRSNAAMKLATALANVVTPIIERENIPNAPNEDLLAAIFTCCVALGECHTRAIVTALHGPVGVTSLGASSLISLLLACQAAPGYYPIHETRSQLTFGFWYMLQDEVSLGTVDTEQALVVVRPLFAQLLTVLLHKARMPEPSSLALDDAELLRCYRQDIADTTMHCYAVLGADCWPRIAEALREAGTEPAAREAVLHALLALADAAPASSVPSALARLIGAAAEAAQPGHGHRQLLHTALECLASYASWLGGLCATGHSAAAGWCAAGLRAAGAALATAPAPATLALQRLCYECPAQAAPLAADIVAAVEEGSRTGRYEGWVLWRLLGAAGRALAAAPPENAEPLLNRLAHMLYRNVQATEGMSVAEWQTASGGALRAAGALMRALDEQRQLAAILFSVLRPTLPQLATVPSLVEPLFQFVEQAVTTLMDDCLPVLEDIYQLCIVVLQATPHPTAIDVIRLIILMFVDDVGCTERCQSLLKELVNCCVNHCVNGGINNLPDRADIAEAFFLAMTSIAKKKSRCLDCVSDRLSETVELAGACLRLSEARAARAACGWICALSACHTQWLRPHAPALTTQALICIGGVTPRNQIEPLADLLLALNKAQWEDRSNGDLGLWLRTALAPDDFPTQHATRQQKQHFISAVIKEKANRRRVLETVREFSLICRGLFGTEYARQALSSRQLVTG